MGKFDEIVHVNLSSDKMKAYINIYALPNDEVPSVQDVKNYLEEKGIVHGVNEEVLEVVLKNRIFNQEVLIAEGTYPVDGINGKLEFHFDVEKDSKPTILEDGRVDYRNLNLIENVKKGQLLCTVIPPQPGKTGKTVTGEIVPYREGVPAKIPVGKNVVHDKEKDALYAAIDGQVKYVGGKINVFPVFEVAGDVDNSTGNINFIGNVIIRGSVLSGFQVEAGGEVEIWGVVEGATIKAGGNIIIRRGVRGNNKAVIISEGDIVAKYIEHSNVEAKNDIKAEAIMHSNIKCGGKLELSGKKGLLVGGDIKVGKEVIAKVIGSPLATSTEIEVGVSPDLREKFITLKKEISNIENDLRKAEQVISILNKLSGSNMLTGDKAELLEKTKNTREYYIQKLSELKEEYKVIEGLLYEKVDGKVKCYGVIYPATKITIGEASLIVKEDMNFCIVYKDGMDIKTMPFR